MLWQSLSPAPFWLFQWRGIWRLYQRENESVFLYRGNVADVASYIVKAYAWTLLLAKDGVASGFYNIWGWNHC